MNLSEIRNKVEQRKGKKAQIETDIKDLNVGINVNNKYLSDLEKAREIVKTVGLITQQNLEFHISDIASLALGSIFADPYKLVLDFVERRNKTECDILFERNEERMKPLNASGGGTVDVASFALRIASWSMSNPRTRNVIILDEPMRFLSTDNQETASEMIKEISNKLGIQFIIITHEQTLAMAADKVFKVNIRKGISTVR